MKIVDCCLSLTSARMVRPWRRVHYALPLSSTDWGHYAQLDTTHTKPRMFTQ